VSLKQRIFLLLESSTAETRAAKVVRSFIMILIVANVVMVALETVKDIQVHLRTFFRWFEIVSVGVFTIEYLLRIWVCTASEAYKGALKGRIKYFFSPFAVVDLVAILPFYIPTLVAIDLRFIRALRLLRLLRIFKLGRYSRAARILWNVLKEKKEELGVTFSVVFILLVVASGVVYFAERETQPQVFSSIPAAMWWAVVTLTTVGYGDVYPVTTLGRIFASVIALLGVGFFALPAGILASGLLEQSRRQRGREITRCPHCGKEISQGE